MIKAHRNAFFTGLTKAIQQGHYRQDGADRGEFCPRHPYERQPKRKNEPAKGRERKKNEAKQYNIQHDGGPREHTPRGYQVQFDEFPVAGGGVSEPPNQAPETGRSGPSFFPSQVSRIQPECDRHTLSRYDVKRVYRNALALKKGE
jgi:hypothetical protein